MERKHKSILCLLLVAALFASCGYPKATKVEANTKRQQTEATVTESESKEELKLSQFTEESESAETKLSEEPEEQLSIVDRVETIISEMTTEEKVAQLFIIAPEQLIGTNMVTTSEDAFQEALKKYPVGGLIFSETNLSDSKQTRDILGAVQGYALMQQNFPIFLCVDESDDPAQIAENSLNDESEDTLTIAELTGEDTESASAARNIIESSLNDIGIHVEFISESDILTSSENAEETFNTPDDATVRAFLAGNDMILFPDDFNSAYQSLLFAVSNGTVSKERLEESLRRILHAKLHWMEQTVGLPNPDKENMFYYIDYAKKWHISYVDPDLPKNDYDLTKLKNDISGIVYNDPRYSVHYGIDVSSHNGPIDWYAVKAAGVDFAMIRVAYRGYGQEGNLHTDERGLENFLSARDAGIKAGVYVFSQAINETEALEEANLVLSVLKDASEPVIVAFDPESITWDDSARTHDTTGEQFTKNTLVFCERIRSAGHIPIIYSNMIWEADVFDLKELTAYPIWYADYEPLPQTPYWFNMWQYTAEGHCPGVEGEVDLDVFFEREESYE